MIPFVDLDAQYRSIKNEIDKAIEQCIADGNFIKGKAVELLKIDLQTILVLNIVWDVEMELMHWRLYYLH